MEKKIAFFVHHHTSIGGVERVTFSLIAKAIENHEGLPTAITEAMICKNAIVSTRSFGGITDLVKHGENGYLSPVGNSKKLAENLKNLINNPKEIESFAEKSFDLAQEIARKNPMEAWAKKLNLDTNLKG
ncbi:MAG: hypothetical protein C4K58_07580 [Flavobacteriaceae bacterium]|nr:MAG: hypothetical protein C4K58_07580 [Flavobacteriaceae bacterium]